MAEYKTIPLDKIIVGERRREIDMNYAAVIGQSMSENGQLQPIAVRATPAAKRPYTLILGGHRYEGARLVEWTDIDAVILKASGTEAQMLEIVENLHRNDLSVLDRAFFVQAYRELWEAKHGAINPKGGRPKNEDKLSPLFEGSFADATAMRLGLHPKAVKRLNQICQNLHPDLRSSVRDTDVADNQSLLLKLAKKGPSEQAGLAAAFRKERDIRKVLSLAGPPKTAASEASKQVAILAALTSAWSAATDETRRAFLQSVELANDFREAAE